MQSRLIYEGIGVAREQAEQARNALTEASPAALERCSEALKAAIAGLERRRTESAVGGPSEPARSEALRLRTDLRVLTRLLEHAAAYHARWLGFAGSAWAGYTGTGAAAGVTRPGRILTQG